jgi:arginase family enzyme
MGMDLVEVDPSRDLLDVTARLANKLLLTFMAGYQVRRRDAGNGG